MILGIDTASNQCAVCLKIDQDHYLTYALSMEYSHGGHLMGGIDHVLGPGQNLNAIAVTTGPGGFTGIRIGLATAKGLGLGYGVDVIGVSCFAVWAAMTQDIWQGQDIVVILDTRRHDFFVQIFSDPHQPKTMPHIRTQDDILELVETRDFIFVGDAIFKIPQISSSLPDSALNIQILCDLAQEIFKEGNQKAHLPNALYIQPPQIQR